jgi:hypothetical protein
LGAPAIKEKITGEEKIAEKKMTEKKGSGGQRPARE